MKRRIWQRLVARVVIMVLAGTALLAVASPAQAYTCSGGQSVNVTTSVAAADVTFYPRCSDNKAHWNGIVRDTKCDGRSGKVMLSVLVWTHTYQANNGCGTSSSFSGSDRAAASPWTLQVAVGACNSWSCSGYFAKYLTG